MLAHWDLHLNVQGDILDICMISGPYYDPFSRVSGIFGAGTQALLRHLVAAGRMTRFPAQPGSSCSLF